jgi:hypothetical protein
MANFAVMIVALQSLLVYLQHVSVTINLPDVYFPEHFGTVLQCIPRVIDFLIFSVSSIPVFDLRVKLVIISVVLPFLAIIFFWFVTSFDQVAYELLDLYWSDHVSSRHHRFTTTDHSLKSLLFSTFAILIAEDCSLV